MEDFMKKALISVYSKEDIVEFAKSLIEKGYEIISTGGTFKILTNNSVKVINVSDLTGSPEMIEGRVKTLHPKIFAGILAKRDNEKHINELKENNINPIDIVVCNLYPFYKSAYKMHLPEDEVLENIDIGGVSLIRAAAKNYKDVIVVTDADDYNLVISNMDEDGNIPREIKKNLAKKAFNYTAIYDSLIVNYFGNEILPDNFIIGLKKTFDVRYGENPHQRAAIYKDIFNNQTSYFTSEQLHGKQLSFNNIMDLEVAKNIVIEFDKPSCAIVKHANPCGVGISNNIFDAYKLSYISDPISAYGSIVALNRKLDIETASEIKSNFVEVVVAPDFEDEAFKILSTKKNIRLIKYNDIYNSKRELIMKSIPGGMLIQEDDMIFEDDKIWKVVTEREPTDKEWNAMKFAWRVAKHVKSNAIVLTSNSRTIGIGAGQMSRIDSCELAIKKAGAVGSYTGGTAMASDGFFPFRDSIDMASKAGITCVIQPGGSIRDKEIIDACNEHNITMLFTGIRHFKH